jgi:hypothetical protein
MNDLPVVTVRHVDGGHQVTCSCEWEVWSISRPTADLYAAQHRASHGKEA